MKRTLIALAAVLAVARTAEAGAYYGKPDHGGGKGRVLWSTAFTIHGLPAEAGDEVAAFGPSGELRGSFKVTAAAQYGFMAVSGDSGELITFRVVDASAKREYTVTTTYIMEKASLMYVSVNVNLMTGGEYDSDGDGMCDYWEDLHRGLGFDPAAYNDPENDTDGDGATDSQEYAANTSLTCADTDADSYTDIIEIRSGSNPNDGGDTPCTIRANFAPNGAAPAAGYVEDSGLPYSGRGYGWPTE